MMLGLVITNFGNVVAEFAGIASSLQLFHVSRFISVPIAAVLVWLLVVKGSYKSVEKVFLAASFFYFAYIIAGVLAGPSWREAFVATFKPPQRHAFHDVSYIYMVIGVVGTTIAPWMQFYLQSSIVEKGITAREYRASRWDVILGCFFTDIVAWFIVVACAATLFAHGIHQIRDGADAAQALRPLAGEYAYILVRRRTVQRVAVRRVDPAAFDGVHGVRRSGVRVGTGQQVHRCEGFLLAVHPAARRRRGA